VEGGAIVIEARRAAGRLELTVVNPADPDRPSRRGHGVGLKNVRDRLATRHGSAAHVDAREARGLFTVQLALPAREERPGASASASPASSSLTAAATATPGAETGPPSRRPPGAPHSAAEGDELPSLEAEA